MMFWTVWRACKLPMKLVCVCINFVKVLQPFWQGHVALAYMHGIKRTHMVGYHA